MKPKRIQRKRTRGWKLPPNTVCVTRPSKWGNPYKLDMYQFENADGSPAPFAKAEARALAVRDFEHALHMGVLPVTVADVRRELKGKHLACWCPVGAKCHADVLLEVANQ